MTKPKYDKFFAYARARYRVMLNKREGGPPPWTDDLALQRYRFCNVFREDDKTTAWFRINIRKALGSKLAEQVRAAVTFRMLNKIESGVLIRDIMLEGDWNLKEIERRLRVRVREGLPILGAAYMIVTPKGQDKVSGIMTVIRKPIKDAPELAKAMATGRSIESATNLLMQYPHIGAFMAYEMATDLRRTPVLEHATDILTWANPGPGAARGAARLVPGINSNRGSKKGVAQMVEVMREILAASTVQRHWPKDWPRWEMREVEHTLCEFDKYERIRKGEGRMKRRYP